MSLSSILIVSFIIISLLGTVLHFTHDIFRKGVLLHIFSAVNESTWEHMKLLVLPTLIASLIQYWLFENLYNNLFNSVLVLLIVEIIAVPLLYEPLRIIFKEVHFVVTIIIFYVAIAVGVYAQHWLLQSGIYFVSEQLSIILIALITALFGIFTYFPPKLFIFKDPVSGKFGERVSN